MSVCVGGWGERGRERSVCTFSPLPCIYFPRHVGCCPSPFISLLSFLLRSAVQGAPTVIPSCFTQPRFAATSTARAACSSHGPCFPLSRSILCVLPMVLASRFHGPFSVFFPWPLLPAFTVHSLCSSHGPCFPLSRSAHCVLPMVLASRFHGPLTVFFPWSLLPAFTARAARSSHGPCFLLSQSVHCVLPMVLASRFHSPCCPIPVLASRFQSLLPAFKVH